VTVITEAPAPNLASWVATLPEVERRAWWDSLTIEERGDLGAE
jgi:hypothetical protein